MGNCLTTQDSKPDSRQYNVPKAITKKKHKPTFMKIAMAGSSKSGKTTIATHFARKHFADTYIETIGVEYYATNHMVDHTKVKFQIWDLCGRHMFRNFVLQYLTHMHGVMVCYDCTNRTSFDEVKSWLEIINKTCIYNPKLLLVGTKNDLTHEKQVSTNEALEFAKEHNMELIEISSKIHKDVEKCFNKIYEKMIEMDETNIIFSEEVDK